MQSVGPRIMQSQHAKSRNDDSKRKSLFKFEEFLAFDQPIDLFYNLSDKQPAETGPQGCDSEGDPPLKCSIDVLDPP
jgi:hypothetical protein